MLNVGLTGGIAAGKSLVAQRLRSLGAVLVDADIIAREVVARGTDGLSEVASEFGNEVLLPDGTLDRAALGARVFADAGARKRLNAIVHPKVRARAEELVRAAPPGAVVVEDLPLLTETGQGARFHLVIVVDAPDDLRVARMVRDRGLSEAAALSRIAAQAGREERNSIADIVIENSGLPEDTLAEVDRLWEQRIVPFRDNLSAGVPAVRPPAPPVAYDPRWPAQAARLAARLERVDPRVLAVEHIGPTAQPGARALDVLDFQAGVGSADDAAALAQVFTAAGFPPVNPAGEPGAVEWRHASADPGRAAELRVRTLDSPAWTAKAL